MAETTFLKTYELDSPEAKKLRSQAVRDIEVDDNGEGVMTLLGN